MPIPATVRASASSCSTPKKAGVSLPVLSEAGPVIRKSKMGPVRACVLIGVHLLIAAHIAHWLIKGRTLSPVEPSESMYSINNGSLNAGLVFFAIAILSTAIFGRFFCGWGCHIVALQDACGWMMKKLGVKPRPFRSRLLVWAPVVLAFYMFAWPTFKREVIRPVVGRQNWETVAPYIGEAGERPEIRAAFMKEDFWETFAPWYVAIPFLAVCGFACVYFLGAKGFCTYGCPYGGIFGPVDRIAPGRIRVTDACEHCGHCTAVCTSNVRVHEEVRDYGMVVDPGCMKCMDCVSVCPNDALYFGFGKPGKVRRTEGPAPFKSRVYDLSWKEEVAYGAVFLLLVIGFRGMFGMVPLLMAMGLAGVTVYLLWKLISLVREPSVRIQSLQLKLKGVVRPLGAAFAALALALAGFGGWGLWINASLWRGTAIDDAIMVPLEQVLTRGYLANEAERRGADRVIGLLRRAAPPSEGGIGWDRSVDRSLRLARAHAIRGDLSAAEEDLRFGIERGSHAGPAPALEAALIKVLGLRSRSAEDFDTALRSLLKQQPKLASVRLLVAQSELSQGRPRESMALIDEAIRQRPDDVLNTIFAADLCARLDEHDRALNILKAGSGRLPQNAMLHEALAEMLDARGNPDTALEEFKAAARLNPRSKTASAGVIRILMKLGRASEATEWRTPANETGPGSGAEPPR